MSKVKDKGRKVIEKKNVALERLEIIYVPLTQIKPNAYNPNRQSDHEYEMLIASIREDGFTDPLKVVKLPEGGYRIVDGEHRWRAAAEVGMTEVPIVVMPVGEAQARIATLRHNRARGSEDIELAVEVLRDLEKLGALDWAQDSLDISDAELTRLLADIPAPQALAAEEYAEAWEPNREASSEEVREIRTGMVQDASPEAVKAQRAKERALAKATSDEERALIEKDRKVFTLNLAFAGEEAEVVKAVLGDKPALTVLRLCQNEAQRVAG